MQTKEADKKAVVCFSGGQDSTTALAMALKSYEAVYTIGFDYGQRHAAELECRSRILADGGEQTHPAFLRASRARQQEPR